jgi:hypothetical protein
MRIPGEKKQEKNKIDKTKRAKERKKEAKKR